MQIQDCGATNRKGAAWPTFQQSAAAAQFPALSVPWDGGFRRVESCSVAQEQWG